MAVSETVECKRFKLCLNQISQSMEFPSQGCRCYSISVP